MENNEWLTPIVWRVLRVIGGKAVEADVQTEEREEAIRLVKTKDKEYCETNRTSVPKIYSAYQLRRFEI